MRTNLAARDSTDVAEQMRRELADLGRPPAAVDQLAADVPELLAVVTWAAESFQAEGRIFDTRHIAPADLRALGFKVCGTT